MSTSFISELSLDKIHLSITESLQFSSLYSAGLYLSISAYSVKNAYVFHSVPIYFLCASDTVSSAKREGSHGALEV